MKSFNIALSIGAIALACAVNPAAAQDTPPTFQGILAKSAAPESSVGPVTFHGGKLINNPKLVDVYWGSLWGPYGNTVALLDTFAIGAMGSNNPVMTMIDQDYSEPGFKIGAAGIGGSVYESEFVLPIETDTTIRERLRGWIEGTIQGIKLPPNSPSALYMVYVQPGTCVMAYNGSNCSGFGTQWCGYHSSFHFKDSTGKIQMVKYSVVPYANQNGCNSLGVDNSMTLIASHEVAEAITDPLGTGWYDSTGNEVGDLCSWQSYNFGPFTMQKIWSNSHFGCYSGQ